MVRTSEPCCTIYVMASELRAGENCSGRVAVGGMAPLLLSHPYPAHGTLSPCPGHLPSSPFPIHPLPAVLGCLEGGRLCHR